MNIVQERKIGFPCFFSLKYAVARAFAMRMVYFALSKLHLVA